MATNESKRARSEEARRRSEENLARELRRSRIQVTVVVSAVVVLIGLAVWAGFVIVHSGDSARADADLELYDSGVLKTPSVVADGGGILLGQDGVAGQGAPANAPVRVDVYLDLLCPICQAFEQINDADIVAMRKDGTVEYYLHPISILDHASAGSQYPTRAAAAAYTVAEYAPEKFDEFLVGLYANQPAEDTVGLTNTQIDQIATIAGVPQDVIDRFKDGEFTQYVASATDQASIAGVRGTPTILLNGQKYDGNWSIQGQFRADVEIAAGIDPAAEPAA